jgi:hypothetical protein
MDKNSVLFSLFDEEEKGFIRLTPRAAEISRLFDFFSFQKNFSNDNSKDN